MLIAQQSLSFTLQKLKEKSKFILAKQRIQLLIVKLEKELQNKKSKNQNINIPETVLFSQDFASCLLAMEEMKGQTQQYSIF